MGGGKTGGLNVDYLLVGEKDNGVTGGGKKVEVITNPKNDKTTETGDIRLGLDFGGIGQNPGRVAGEKAV